MARLLIADDDAGILESMKTLLEILGHEVEAVPSPDDVMARVEAWTPDLVLHDLHMPGLDFAAQMKALRAGEVGSKVPVVVFSGDIDAAQQAALLGAQGALTKPFEPTTLEKMVDALIGPPNETT